MKKILLLAVLIPFCVSAGNHPTITGQQTQLTSHILKWKNVWSNTLPNLHGGGNQINDINTLLNDCDLVISTAGNYNAALSEYMRDVFLHDNHKLQKHGNVIWTTSPPVSIGHIENGGLIVGRFNTTCIPDVAIGPKKLMDTLIAKGFTDGHPIPVIKNYGNVIVVRKDETRITSIADLGKYGKHVTSKSDTEGGSFGNFASSTYNIAVDQYGELIANDIFNRIYNNDTINGGEPNYISWGPIMHRGIPQALSEGYAVSGVTFRHLGVQWVDEHPDLFKIVPLGGTVENPEPLQGNKVATLFIVKIKKKHRSKYAEKIIKGYQSHEFTDILIKHGLRRP